jgi:DNA-binding transcriptional LysR family regulator
MQPDFNRLHLFYQIFRHGSIAGAAEDLFVTQSAISQNLQKLEQELSITLFHRLHKKLVPTASAQQLFQTIMPFFSTLPADLAAIHSSEAGPQGVVRIGAPPVFGAEFLPHIIAAFRAKYPAVKFHLSLGPQSVIAHAYRNGELDIALVDIFGNREEQSWNLLQEPLLDEPLILVGSVKYIRRHLKSGLSMEAISQCQFVAYQTLAPELTEWFSHHFQHSIKQPDIVLIVENVHAVIGALRNHLGLGIVPHYLVQSAIRKKELAAIRVGKDEVKSRISLLRLPKRKPATAEKLFIDFIKSKLTDTRVKSAVALTIPRV